MGETLMKMHQTQGIGKESYNLENKQQLKIHQQEKWLDGNGNLPMRVYFFVVSTFDEYFWCSSVKLTLDYFRTNQHRDEIYTFIT